jgi:hypothetical protein
MSLHVECGRAGGGGPMGQSLPIEIGAALAWSETVATTGTTTNAVPSNGLAYVLTLTPTINMWVAIGPTPVSTDNPRRRLLAGVPRSFVAQPGDRVAWE